MPGLFTRSRPSKSELAYTLESRISVHNREIVQLQFVTEHYVVTRVDRLLTLFWAAERARFIVDPVQRRLQRVDLAERVAQIGRLRDQIGTVDFVADDSIEMVGDHHCRRIAFAIESPHAVVSGEVHYTRLPELAGTAFLQEREFEEGMQLVRLPFEADEVAVRSSMRTLANGFEQNQTSRLEAFEPRIESLDECDRFLTYPIVG